MTDDELVHFAREFREGILDGRSSWMRCFMVSAPLVTVLGFEGVRGELAEGEFGECNHCWITLPDGRVLDATIDQFRDEVDPGLPDVYLGEPIPWIHREGEVV